MTKFQLKIVFYSLFLLTHSVFATANEASAQQQVSAATDASIDVEINSGADSAAANSNHRYVYDVYYKSISIGDMTQEYRWKGKNVEVNSVADFSFLYFSFGGSQQSDIVWDETKNLFLSRSFVRESVGFSTVEMTAKFDPTGHHSEVVNNGESAEYSNQEGPIVDFNTVTLQIGEGLKKGQTDFEFYMQTSDDIAHYYFQLKGTEVIKTKFGEMEVYRVQQTRKKDRTFIAWFAPHFDYQMVKFEYQRKVLDIHGELVEHGTDF